MKNRYLFYQSLQKKIRLFILIGLSVFLFAQINGQTSSVNLSGNWALNESKSQLGDGPFSMAPKIIVIKQEGNNLLIDRTMNGPDGGEMKLTGKYTLDGKVCENSGIMDMKTKSTVTWASDKMSFTIVSSTFFEMNGDSREMKSTEIWKTGKDNKSIIIEATNTTPEGDMKTIMVYDKK
jgi:hypothetical protein